MRRILALVFGLLLLWMSTKGGFLVEEKDDLEAARDGGGSAVGRVVELREHEERSGSRRSRTTRTVECPVVEFTHAGTRERFTEYGDCSGYVVGDEVDVIWPADEPQTAFIDSDAVAGDVESGSRLPLLLRILGVVFAGGALLSLGLSLRRWLTRRGSPAP